MDSDKCSLLQNVQWTDSLPHIILLQEKEKQEEIIERFYP